MKKIVMIEDGEVIWEVLENSDVKADTWNNEIDDEFVGAVEYMHNLLDKANYDPKDDE